MRTVEPDMYPTPIETQWTLTPGTGYTASNNTSTGQMQTERTSKYGRHKPAHFGLQTRVSMPTVSPDSRRLDDRKKAEYSIIRVDVLLLKHSHDAKFLSN